MKNLTFSIEFHKHAKSDPWYFKRYPFGTSCSMQMPGGTQENFFAHYKRGHGRRTVMLEKASSICKVQEDLAAYYPELLKRYYEMAAEINNDDDEY